MVVISNLSRVKILLRRLCMDTIGMIQIYMLWTVFALVKWWKLTIMKIL